MLQLHLIDQQFYCLRCNLYQRFYSIYTCSKGHNLTEVFDKCWVIILTKFSSLAPQEVVNSTTYSAVSDDNFVKMKIFPFQCNSEWYQLFVTVVIYTNSQYFLLWFTPVMRYHGKESFHKWRVMPYDSIWVNTGSGNVDCIISEVLWHSDEGNFTGNAPDIYPRHEFENY